MIERTVEQEHRLDGDEAISRRVERFSVEKQVNEFFQSILAEGQVLSRDRYPTKEAAEARCGQFAEAIYASAVDIEGLEHIVFRAEGPGVLCPNISATIDGHGQIGILHFNTDDPLANPGPASDCQGRYIGMLALGRLYDDGTFGPAPYLILEDTKKQVVGVNKEHYNFPLSTVTIENRILVACDGSADIEIPTLTQYDARRDALAKVAVRHHGNRSLLGALQKLNAVIYGEQEAEPTSLKKPKLLRTIGEAIQATAPADIASVDTILTAAGEMLAKGRDVSLSGEVIAADGTTATFAELHGSVLDILPQVPHSETNEPVLVVSGTNGEDKRKSIWYVPLAHIDSFKF